VVCEKVQGEQIYLAAAAAAAAVAVDWLLLLLLHCFLFPAATSTAHNHPIIASAVSCSLNRCSCS
jgi:hypothetical protein